MESAKSDLITPRRVVVAVVVYIVGFAVYWSLVRRFTDDFVTAGQFGDMFGGFNAFVSGLAMLGVIAAILLQREQNRMQAEELRLQRIELKQTRDELEGQKLALLAQKEAMEEQTAHLRKTSEAALMQQLMTEYDGLRESIDFIQRWRKHHPLPLHVRRVIEELASPRPADEAQRVDLHRHNVSRFFVKVRRLATNGHVPDSLVVIALEKAAVEMFLNAIDPLDEAVSERYSSVDRDYYKLLLERHYPLEARLSE